MYSATVLLSNTRNVNSHCLLQVTSSSFALNTILSKHSLAGNKIDITSLILLLKRSPQLEILTYVKCQCAQCIHVHVSSVATCAFMCTTLCMAGVAPHIQYCIVNHAASYNINLLTASELRVGVVE